MHKIAINHTITLVFTAFMLIVFVIQATQASESKQPFKQKTLSPVLKKFHLSYPECSLVNTHNANAPLQFFSYQLDKNNQLYGILCEGGFYNTSFSLYQIKNNNYHNAQRLYFPAFSSKLGWGGTNSLYNASYDPDTRLLKSKTKFHKSKDCGTTALYRWIGTAFRLLNYRRKGKCTTSKSRKWPLVYRYGTNKKRIASRSRQNRKSKRKRRYRKRRAFYKRRAKKKRQLRRANKKAKRYRRYRRTRLRKRRARQLRLRRYSKRKKRRKHRRKHRRR